MLLLNKIPESPLSKNSDGPLGQLLEIINKFDTAASTITKPTSSQREGRMNKEACFIYL